MSNVRQPPMVQQYQQPVGHEFEDPSRASHKGYTSQGNSGLGSQQVQHGQQPIHGGLSDHPQARDMHNAEHQHRHHHPDVNQLRTDINTAAHTGQPRNNIGGLGGGYGAGVAGKHDGTFGKHDPDYHAEQARRSSLTGAVGPSTNNDAFSGSQTETSARSYDQSATGSSHSGQGNMGGAIHETKPDATSKPSLADKLSGTVDIAVGKMTKNTEKVELGQAKKEGLLH
ncbi:hypothetical protein OIV83_004046 [Microbotryomycetes sp. JL201]|nr:hypothetical protein OIV83_004046 [Microbotryomycetes sp. JL201]